MVEKVPIARPYKTGCDCGCDVGWLLLTNVDAKIRILLQKNAAGHLLVDLTHDWLAQGQLMASACGRV